MAIFLNQEVKMSTKERDSKYDAIVIGSGQGGTPLATYLAEQGMETALIEKEHVGGTCVNEGCTPTKTMIASARVAHVAGRSDDYGVHTGDTQVDLAEVRERKRDIVEKFREGNLKGIKNQSQLDLIRGTASFADSREIKIELESGSSKLVRAEKIFIDTGARPAAPPIEGLESVDYLDSTSIMELGETPEKLLIIGGGYIGVEFGQAFRRFGSKVTLFQRSSQLLPHEDEDIAGEIKGILEEEGVNVKLNHDVRRVEETEKGKRRLVATGPEGENDHEGTHLLVAAGRAPNTEELNLENTGVRTTERGYVKVNERLETDQSGVYALGDVKGGPAFTHISYDDFRILRDNLFEGGSRNTENRLVPYTLFTDPQLGRVGLTEKEAREKGYEIKIATMPMSGVARALEVDESRGIMKVVVDGETEEILGAAILGIEGGEIASAIQIAMMGNLSYKKLKEGIFAHPTLAESLNNLFSGKLE
uniref:Pyridine nucleotide-disulfide oxidoreductase dimerization region n=1 Tax=uncultured organism TaxID=155900 RepID=M1PP31_9ZZZZ|nr:pyridine nucleotide-disulfide oxidoreductase dimerization region [uncultured organism]